MKKYYLLLTPLFSLTPIFALAQGEYQALEPTLFESIGVTTANTNLVDYIQNGFTLFLVVTIVLSVLLMVVGGVEIIVSQVPGVKVQGKQRIYAALTGLALALSSVLLLQILNPKITQFDLSLSNISTPPPNTSGGGNGQTDPGQQGNIDAGEYFKDEPQQDMVDFTSDGKTISKIDIDPQTKKMTLTNSSGETIVRDINIGQSGFSAPGEGYQGDNKTPTGTFSVNSDIRIGENGQAVFTSNGQTNMGAAFVNIGATDSGGVDRGIGIHGSNDNRLRPTNGCIRMKNEDLELIAPLIQSGTQINIS